jgi:glucokinase
MNHPDFPHPALVGDIGGTNARFALAETPGAEPRILAKVKTRDFAGPQAAIEAVTRDLPVKPRSVLLCGAGPVNGLTCHLTNADWFIDGAQLAPALTLSQGFLLNDFEAQALALPALPPAALRTIGPDLPEGPGARVVLGPGTGLGVGALVKAGDLWVPIPSEGGHIDLAVDGEDWPVLSRVEKVMGRLTAEVVLSGSGIARLHAARRAVLGGSGPDDTIAIVETAVASPGGPEAETIREFLRLLARFAGDMALTFGATGGVYLSGGILPRIAPLLDADAFRAAFDGKEPVDWLPRSIATRLVVSPDAVLHGMAAIAAAPRRYLLDYDRRMWVR